MYYGNGEKSEFSVKESVYEANACDIFIEFL